MSDTEPTAPAVEYMVQRHGGTLHPDDAALQAWCNEQAKAGWRLVCVDQGTSYWQRGPAARRDAQNPR